jgi:hypothetical protein
MVKKIAMNVVGKPKGTYVKLYVIKPGKNCFHITLLINNRMFKCKSGRNWTRNVIVSRLYRGPRPKGAMYNPTTGIIKVKF